jgi:hypothetical protein
MTPNESRPSPGQHLTTVSHAGRFWDVYLEFEDNPKQLEHFRGLLAFAPVDRAEGESTVRTIPILIETSYERVVQRAQMLEMHQLSSFLRSLLP